MGKFGWSYPPGCSGPPEPPEPSALEEAILELLENAGVPAETNDKIVKLIQDWEMSNAAHEPDPIPDDPFFDEH